MRGEQFCFTHLSYGIISLFWRPITIWLSLIHRQQIFYLVEYHGKPLKSFFFFFFLEFCPGAPLVFTASSIISCIRGVKRCIVLFFFDRTCERELARGFEQKIIFSGKKRLPELCSWRFHRFFGFLHRQGAFQFTKREIILTRDQSKVF